MDMKMAAQVERPNEYPIWDVKVENGIVPIVTGLNEELQKAILAGFLERGTIPNLPLQGVPYTVTASVPTCRRGLSSFTITARSPSSSRQRAACVLLPVPLTAVKRYPAPSTATAEA